MNYRREFEIAFVGLKPGIHEFKYKIDNKFFSSYSKQDFVDCEAAINLQLDKKNGFMLLKFDIDGAADVSCDICGNAISMQLWDEYKMMVKMVENPDEMNVNEEDPDVYYISKGESHLQIADWIFEFITLSLPYQKRCADNERGGPKCNKEVLAKLNALHQPLEKEINPVWKGLSQFKNLE